MTNVSSEPNANKLGITEVVLRDGHQSLIATRMRLDDMLPIAEKLDQVGYWSLETWGGATFDACIRYLGEDPWARLRALKQAMPNTPQQMLLRGQNLLGYRHYADDVVQKFVERAAHNGIDVFRVFDAMNDVRNLETAVRAVLAIPGKHAQGTISYTVSPVHTLQSWVDMAKQIEDLGAHSIAIKDMAGLLTPPTAFELVSAFKEAVKIPLQLHCHATTGLSTATALKAIEAGIDTVDTAISSFSMTYGHSPTETVVAMMADTDRATGLDLNLLTEIAAYFREVRKKYAKFEGSLRGVDARILVAQVPGGMLTNMENQLKEQKALDRFDDVLAEIPRVRKDLGYIPLVTPTSQIVGTQAVINVLSGERYKLISRETQGVLKGEYGAAPAGFDVELQARVLGGAEAITERPANLLNPEVSQLTQDLRKAAKESDIALAQDAIDDVLTYALFPQVGLKFLMNRDNPDAFEPAPGDSSAETAPEAAPANPAGEAVVPNAESAPVVDAGGVYTVTVDGESFVVEVTPGGQQANIAGKSSETKKDAVPEASIPKAVATDAAHQVSAPLAGNIFKVVVSEGQSDASGDILLVLEAMKMETEVRAPSAGRVTTITAKEGESVAAGAPLMCIA